jgi:hypothetical protein
MIRDARAIVYGLGVFLILHVGYLYLEASITNAFLPMVWLFFATPVLAGGVTGYFAQRQPFLSLLVLGIAASVCVGLLHMLWTWLGLHNSVGGLSGSVTLGIFSLVFVLLAVIVGGAVGAYISRAHS